MFAIYSDGLTILPKLGMEFDQPLSPAFHLVTAIQPCVTNFKFVNSALKDLQRFSDKTIVFLQKVHGISIE